MTLDWRNVRPFTDSVPDSRRGAWSRRDTPWAVGEAALAHTIGNSVEAAYARTDLFERRRNLMAASGPHFVAEPAQSERSAGRR